MKNRLAWLKFLPLLLAGTLCAGCVFFFACENRENASAESRGRAGFSVKFPVRVGEKTLSLRMAITDLERSQGLTGCRGLPEDSGMLFVYADSAPRGFWMRGVPIGLSIAFFDAAGTLLEIHEMKPNDLNTTYSRADNVKFVLEMSSHWFAKNGVAAGTRLNLDDVSAAVVARGFLPKNYINEK